MKFSTQQLSSPLLHRLSEHIFFSFLLFVWAADTFPWLQLWPNGNQFTLKSSPDYVREFPASVFILFLSSSLPLCQTSWSISMHPHATWHGSSGSVFGLPRRSPASSNPVLPRRVWEWNWLILCVYDCRCLSSFGDGVCPLPGPSPTPSPSPGLISLQLKFLFASYEEYSAGAESNFGK